MDHVLGDDITQVLGLTRDRRYKFGTVRGGPRSFSLRDTEGIYHIPIHVIETRMSNAGLHLMNGSDRWLIKAKTMDAWAVAEQFTNDVKEFQTKAYDMAIRLSAGNGGKFNVNAGPDAGVEVCLDTLQSELLDPVGHTALQTEVGLSKPLQKRHGRSSSSDSFDFDSFDFDSSSSSSSSESSDSYSSSNDDELIDLLDELLSAF